MKKIEEHSLTEQIITSSKTGAYSYKAYRNFVEDLVADGKTSGTEQKESLIEYTRLNSKRMKRWDKTIKLPELAYELLNKFDKPVLWIVLTESWCGDAAPSIPVMNKIAESTPNITLKLVLRDKNPELMNLFLTNGSMSIPKLIMVDLQNNQVLNTWGPRPSRATKLVESYKAEHGELSPEFKQDLQLWYNKDKGQNILDDLMELLTLK